jgi:hypothetical protein
LTVKSRGSNQSPIVADQLVTNSYNYGLRSVLLGPPFSSFRSTHTTPYPFDSQIPGNLGIKPHNIMSDGRRGLPLLSGPPPTSNDANGPEIACRKCNKEFNFMFNRRNKCNHCGEWYISLIIGLITNRISLWPQMQAIRTVHHALTIRR